MLNGVTVLMLSSSVNNEQRTHAKHATQLTRWHKQAEQDKSVSSPKSHPNCTFRAFFRFFLSSAAVIVMGWWNRQSIGVAAPSLNDWFKFYKDLLLQLYWVQTPLLSLLYYELSWTFTVDLHFRIVGERGKKSDLFIGKELFCVLRNQHF